MKVSAGSPRNFLYFGRHDAEDPAGALFDLWIGILVRTELTEKKRISAQRREGAKEIKVAWRFTGALKE